MPKCGVLAGPVSPGRVSPRTVLPPGRYRVPPQSYSTNPTANDYRVDIESGPPHVRGRPSVRDGTEPVLGCAAHL